MAAEVGAIGKAVVIRPLPGDGGDNPVGRAGHGRDFADGVVELVGHKEIARKVRHYSGRPIKKGLGIGAVLHLGLIDLVGAAGDGADGPIGAGHGDLANGATDLIRNIKIALAVQGHAGRPVEQGAGIGAVRASRRRGWWNCRRRCGRCRSAQGRRWR